MIGISRATLPDLQLLSNYFRLCSRYKVNESLSPPVEFHFQAVILNHQNDVIAWLPLRISEILLLYRTSLTEYNIFSVIHIYSFSLSNWILLSLYFCLCIFVNMFYCITGILVYHGHIFYTAFYIFLYVLIQLLSCFNKNKALLFH